MFSKSNILSIISSFLILFLGGWLFYGVLMASFFNAHLSVTTNLLKEPDMLFIAFGCLIQAIVLVAIYPKWARGKHTAKFGLEFGAFIGAFIGFGIGLINLGTINTTDQLATLVDGVWNIIFYAIVGLAIALVFKNTDK